MKYRWMRLFISSNPIKTPLFLFSLLRSSNSFRLRPTPLLCSLRLRSYSVDSDSSRESSLSSPSPMAIASKSVLPSVDTGAGLAQRYWIKFHRETIFAMYTPFLVCLTSGNLKIETFRHFLAQDVHFLRAVAQAYELAEKCADDDDAKLGISYLRKVVLEELKMHDSFVQEWGLGFIKDVAVNSATLKYTDFLLATASGKVEGVKCPGKLATPFEKTKVAAYTLGAVCPCMRLYAFMGKEIQELVNCNKDTHPYQKWIHKYSSDSFQATAQQTEELLDKLSVSLTGEELDVIEKLYHQALKLQTDFFLAQPFLQPTIVPLVKGLNLAEDHLVIFSDFDLTCTVVDSSAILAEIAIVTAPKLDQDQPDEQIMRMSSTDLRNTWGFLSKQYTEEYEQCIESIMPAQKMEKFSYEELHMALTKLAEFEKAANNIVIESGVLKGLNLEDIERAGERVVLQDGCTKFFQRIFNDENLKTNVHILSYCWCSDFIKSAFSSAGLPELDVHANELVFEGLISSGEIIQKVESPVDKVHAFSRIIRTYGNERRNCTVYIGDSVGDLLSLLEADIGIVIGSSSSLREVGAQFGVTFVPLFSGLVQKQRECGESSCEWKGLSGILYTVSSWHEVHAFVLGC